MTSKPAIQYTAITADGAFLYTWLTDGTCFRQSRIPASTVGVTAGIQGDLWYLGNEYPVNPAPSYTDSMFARVQENESAA